MLQFSWSGMLLEQVWLMHPREDANRQSVGNGSRHQSEGSADGSFKKRSRTDRVGRPRADLMRNNKRSRDDGNGGSSDQACYKCGQLGHRQASCPRNSGGAGPSGAGPSGAGPSRHGGGGRHGGRPGRGGGHQGGSNMHN